MEGVGLIVGEGLCSNVYVFGCEEATLVDTGVGDSYNPLFPQLAELGVEPSGVSQVVLTHAHHDHALGLYLLREKANPRVLVHEEDSRYLAANFENLVRLRDGDAVETSWGSFEVVWTPGHTRGSICLYNAEGKVLVSGDTVFPDGYYGRFDGPSGSLEEIVKSLERLSQLDVEVMLPGHGSPLFEGANKHIAMSLERASRHL